MWRGRDISWAYHAYTPDRLAEQWVHSKEALMRISDRAAYESQMKRALGLS